MPNAQADQDLSFQIVASPSTAQADQDSVFQIVTVTSTAEVDQDLVFVISQRLAPAIIKTQADQDLVFPIVKRIFGQRQVTGHFEDIAGNPIANGTIFFKITTDAVYRSPSRNVQVVATVIKIKLTATGDIPEGTFIWVNDQLTPAETAYLAYVETAAGQTVWKQTLPIPSGSGPYDLSTFIPA